jgi:hypothetical protein
MAKATKITQVHTDSKGTIKKVDTPKGSMTPKQVAGKIDHGKDFTHKGQPVHSVDGDHIRTNPNDKKGDNLVKRK